MDSTTTFSQAGMGQLDLYSIQQCAMDDLVCSESFKDKKYISSGINSKYNELTYCDSVLSVVLG